MIVSHWHKVSAKIADNLLVVNHQPQNLTIGLVSDAAAIPVSQMPAPVAQCKRGVYMNLNILIMKPYSYYTTTGA